MNSVRELRGLDLSAISAWIASCDQPYEPSELYATAVHQNITESSVRKSESRTLVDPALFTLCEALVRDVSASDMDYTYTLVPDNLTHIRYLPGGFFSRHVDHCRGVSNMIEEFTLICHVEHSGVACRGGHTVIHTATADGGTTPTTFDSTTARGGGLLFRKDVEHEGLPVEAGEKHVLCLNLWGRRKKHGQVLLVSLLPSTDAADSMAASGAGVAALHAASADKKSFALAAEDAAVSHPLKLVLAEANELADERDEPHPPIVRYTAPAGVESESMAVVFRICCRMHVTTAMLEAHKDALGFFFPGANLTWENLLVEHAHDPRASLEHEPFRPGMTVSIFGTATSLDGKTAVVLGDAPAGDAVAAGAGEKLRVRLVSKSHPEDAPTMDETPLILPRTSLKLTGFDHLINGVVMPPSGADPGVTPLDPDVIVTASAERTKVVAALARELDLPFVEFNLMLVKGDLCGEVMPLTACWLSLGGYDNVFSLRQVLLGSVYQPSTLIEQLLHKDYFLKARRMANKSERKVYSPLDAAEKVGACFKLADKLTNRDGDRHHSDDYYSDSSMGDCSSSWEDSWWWLGSNYCFGLKCAATELAGLLLRPEPRPPRDEVDEDDEDWSEYEEGSPIMDVIFKRRGSLQGAPKLTYLPGGESFAPSGHAGGGGEMPSGWRQLLSESAAARQARAQAEIDEAKRAMQRMVAEIKEERKEEAKKEWLEAAKARHEDEAARSTKRPQTRRASANSAAPAPFDSVAEEEAFEANWTKEEEEGFEEWQGGMWECAWENGQQQERYGSDGFRRYFSATWNEEYRVEANEEAYLMECYGIEVGKEEDVDGAKEKARAVKALTPWSVGVEGGGGDGGGGDGGGGDGGGGDGGGGEGGGGEGGGGEGGGNESARCEAAFPPAGAWLFHVDEAGKTAFSEAEARAASELIAAMKLDERVVSQMEKVSFVFPQESTSMSASHLCNHDWFGSFELLQVTGVVRLQADPELVRNAFAAEAEEACAKIDQAHAERRKQKEDYEKRERLRREAMERARLEREQDPGAPLPTNASIQLEVARKMLVADEDVQAGRSSEAADLPGTEGEAGPEPKKAKTEAKCAVA